MSPNGTLYILDLGADGKVVWSNEFQTNRTTATCSPYSLSVLASGVLVERDCANKTVYVVPQLAGGHSLHALFFEWKAIGQQDQATLLHVRWLDAASTQLWASDP
jgi:hypothetical protein